MINTEYIEKHKYSTKKLTSAGIELLQPDEIFVQYPLWNDYYGSSYGRLISVKDGQVKLLKPADQNGYFGYKLAKVAYGKQRIFSISAHRLVADIFLPNYWKHLDRNQLQAHHLDHNKLNNDYRNLVLLPTALHQIMNRVKRMVLLQNGQIIPVTPYEASEATGLTLDEIILGTKQKPLKSPNKYSVYQIGNHLIGVQWLPKKSKKKK